MNYAKVNQDDTDLKEVETFSEPSNRKLKIKILSVLMFAFAIVFPGLTSDPNSMKEISKRDSKIGPAAYAFAIWGPIYLLLALYAVY